MNGRDSANMEEGEHLLIDETKGQVVRVQAQRQRRRKTGKVVLFWTLVFLAVVWAFRPGDDVPWRWGCHRHHRHGHHIHHDGEHIKWKSCGELTGHPLECSELHVPMDHFDKENSGDHTFMIPLIRLRAQNATKSLFLNPGGPGGSGIDLIARRGADINTIVGEGFHLLSFDPRGVAGSRPRAMCYPDGETRHEMEMGVHDKHLIVDSPDVWAWTNNHGAACAETMGEHGKYINTPQTAADMNSILDAIGQDGMVYWGFSYGTILGQTYASLFPERSERVIIDGVANVFEWYESKFFEESLTDTDNVLHGFVDECVKAGSNCSLSSLASSKEDLLEKITTFGDNLRPDPISVYVNSTLNGIFGRQTLWFSAIFPAMYAPARWPSLAATLTKLLQGNATEAYLAYGVEMPFADAMQDDSNQFVVMNDGVSGPKNWPEDRLEILDMLLNYVNTSSFASVESRGIYERRAWSVPQTHNFVPKNGVETAHPLLILSTTYDPVCPLTSARAANKAFEGSRLVEVKGYGHCSISIPSLCIAKHVRNFLYEGKLPDENETCERNGVYFPAPEEKTVQAEWLGLDDEERRLHEAQIAMAEDTDWLRPRVHL